MKRLNPKGRPSKAACDAYQRLPADDSSRLEKGGVDLKTLPASDLDSSPPLDLALPPQDLSIPELALARILHQCREFGLLSEQASSSRWTERESGTF